MQRSLCVLHFMCPAQQVNHQTHGWTWWQSNRYLTSRGVSSIIGSRSELCVRGAAHHPAHPRLGRGGACESHLPDRRRLRRGEQCTTAAILARGSWACRRTPITCRAAPVLRQAVRLQGPLGVPPHARSLHAALTRGRVRSCMSAGCRVFLGCLPAPGALAGGPMRRRWLLGLSGRL